MPSIRNPSFFIQKAKKIACGAALSSVFLASILATGCTSIQNIHQRNFSDEPVIVDLSNRSNVQVDIGHGEKLNVKILEYGEYADPKLSKKYYDERVSSSQRSLSGTSTLIGAGRFSEQSSICLIKHDQGNAKISPDGKNYLFKDQHPVVIDKAYADFFIASHETEHCFFNYMIPRETLSKINDDYNEALLLEKDINKINSVIKAKKYSDNYVGSLNETAADLAAILDWMRQTGNGDIYKHFIRPFRISSFGSTDHRTAWAIDEVMKDIDPVKIYGMAPESIPTHVNKLMEKHFSSAPGVYAPDWDHLIDGKLSIDKPAAIALLSEVMTDLAMTDNAGNIHNEDLIPLLKEDIRKTISIHIQSHWNVVDEAAIKMAAQNYKNLAEGYGLGRLEAALVNDRPEPPMVTSFLSKFTEQNMKMAGTSGIETDTHSISDVLVKSIENKNIKESMDSSPSL